MAAEINIPKLGMTMEFAKLVEWKAKEGDWVEKSKAALAIETEKVSWETQAIGSGYLHIIVEIGHKAKVGAVVGMLCETREELAKVQEKYPKGDAVRPKARPAVATAPGASSTPAKPAAKALKKFPIMNSNLIADEILLFEDVHVGIAVALPEGLIVPVLKHADKMNLLQIARGARELANKARQGTLSVDEVTGGTFTISNTSMFPVDAATPILKPPETGILGISRLREKPAVYKGEIAIRTMMTLSLTFDHRVVDGAPAAEFVGTVARYIENPCLLLA